MPETLKRVYHRLIPKSVRYPIGGLRRSLVDTWKRQQADGPLPPRPLLRKVQMTPWIDEYLAVGAKSHGAISRALADHGIGAEVSEPIRALDFGCGLARTLRYFKEQDHQGHPWRLAGCDVDPALVDWSRNAFPHMDIRHNQTRPPLPWDAGAFDGLWAVSVFTHFDREQQDCWAAEVARVLRPGGLAIITTMGEHALGGFPNLNTAANARRLKQEGFYFHRVGDTFNANGAFHTEAGVRRVFEDEFELLQWRRGGLDGFQDLTVLRRR